MSEREKFLNMIRAAVGCEAAKITSGQTTLLIFRDRAHFDEWDEKKVLDSESCRIVCLPTSFMLLSGFQIPSDADINKIAYCGVAFSNQEDLFDSVLQASLMFVPK